MHDEPKPRIPLTRKERAFVDALRLVYPGGLGYRLDSAEDRQTEEDARRLIEAAVVERIKETAPITDTGETADAAVYRLTGDFVGNVGGTPRPQDN
jgi:hypothetical protein